MEGSNEPTSTPGKLSKRQRRRQAREQRKQAFAESKSSNTPSPLTKQPSKESHTQKRNVAGDRPPPQIITEGSATIQLPAHVFYNRCQVFNRDLTIAVINQLLRSHVFSSSGRKLPPLPLPSEPPSPSASASSETSKKPAQENSSTTPASMSPTPSGANQQELPEQTDRLYGKVRILEALAASGLRYLLSIVNILVNNTSTLFTIVHKYVDFSYYCKHVLQRYMCVQVYSIREGATSSERPVDRNRCQRHRPERGESCGGERHA